jgi:glycosyltransferase involved in cell wall biosynthesis
VKVLALIPAYNEETSISGVVEASRGYVDCVVVVDDGSRDQTAARAEQAGATVLRQAINGGKGAALAAGSRYAIEQGYDVAVTLDADGQHDPQSIPDLLEPLRLGQADMAVGSRKTQWSKHMPVVRRITNAWMSWFLSLLAGQPMEDTQSGYRAISTEVLRHVQVDSTHFEAESEFLLVAARLRYRIAWVPIRVIYGLRPSHIHPIRDTVRFAVMMARVLLVPRRST